MRLGEKQELFMEYLPRLIGKAHILGFDVRGGELQRSPEAARWNASHCRVCKKTKRHQIHRGGHTFKSIGIVNSLHIKKLAIDLLLFRNGIYLTRSEDYIALGKYWKTLNTLCRWGGDFRNPDGGHFSLTHGGRA